MSFVFEEGPKGASAKHVKEEEGGEAPVKEEEGEREFGKVKSYSEEKGFAFIVSGPTLPFSGSKHRRPRRLLVNRGKRRCKEHADLFLLQGRCVGGDDLFAHKREFGSVEPSVGLPVSFVVEATDKGDAAKKYLPPTPLFRDVPA